ncbi:MAG: tRNA uridine-5-carboxymethylaminomethyl(34) synthesis GTPase MnmE [Bacteroidales bacterium]|nr:tRNA uridine-5-carboxymethylaminomethyl(34) synthesis GTPase MnmE [Bacteroidales bacterium]
MLQDQNNSTICAQATALGQSAIAVIRVSGPRTFEIVSKVFASRKGRRLEDMKGFTLCYGALHKEDGTMLDDALLSVFRSPASYTGEDMAEISCHASPYIVSELLRALVAYGCEYAAPGEFTRRAFVNGKMDLAQAEAVADIIASETEASHKIAINQLKGGFSKELAAMREQLLHIVSLMELELDFSEEDVEFADRSELRSLLGKASAHIGELISSFKLGNAIKNGVPVAIVGATNTGKSTLLNALLGEDRAIVSSIAGTTRDTIEDTMNVGGILFRFIDTAGIRRTMETIEIAGIERTYYKIKQASIVMLVLDYTRQDDFEESVRNLIVNLGGGDQRVIILLNKIDEKPVVVTNLFEGRAPESITPEENINKVCDIISGIAAANNLTPLAILPISAKKKIGLDELRNLLTHSQQDVSIGTESVLVANLRHYTALKEASDSLLKATVALDERRPADLISQDIREALYSIGTIVGEISTSEILENIFSKFCIGK